MCAPLACQSFIAAGLPWNLFFFGSLVLSVFSALLAFYAFRPTASEFEQDVSRAVHNAQSQDASSATLIKDKDTSSAQASEENVGLAELKDVPAPAKSAYFSSSNQFHHGITRGQLDLIADLLRAFKSPVVWAFALVCGTYSGL